MASKSVFQRYELKYMLTQKQKEKVLSAMEPYMRLDDYGRSTIRNIYYDTDTYLLIRRSIEKPAYKEKLRIRTYNKGTGEDKVFVELKKKYDHVVYKRRVSLPESEAVDWLEKRNPSQRDLSKHKAQIAKEIDWVLDQYENLRPAVYLSYEREAYYALDGSDFRVTFDDHILGRTEELSFQSENYGTLILPEDRALMEIKCSGGIPLWMTKVLSEEKIYKTSFSKYGTLYKNVIFPQINTGKERVAYWEGV